MKEILQYLIKIFSGFGREKQFVYNFDIYDGTEQDVTITDTNVVEYEFVNLGTSLIYINDMPLYPVASQKQFHRIKMQMNFNEMDVTIYKIKFQAVPDFYIHWDNRFDLTPPLLIWNEQPNTVDPPYPSFQYNRLLVISKVKANKKSSKPS